MARPPIANVPAVIPSTPRELIYLPLRAGEPVLLLGSDCGLQAWKAAFEVSGPPMGYSFQLRDSLAIPIGPATPGDPAVDDAPCLQSADGRTYIALSDG